METQQTEAEVAPYPHTGWAAWVFVFVSVTLMVQPFAEALPNHGVDPDWTAHARFHLASGLANQFFFGVAAILVARIPYRRGERWSWWALAAFALAMLCMVPATLWSGSGPARTFWPIIGGQMAAMVIALAATAPMLRARRP